jgi:hypothetical protein
VIRTLPADDDRTDNASSATQRATPTTSGTGDTAAMPSGISGASRNSGARAEGVLVEAQGSAMRATVLVAEVSV